MNEELQDELDQCAQHQHYQNSMIIDEIHLPTELTLDQLNASLHSASLPQQQTNASPHVATTSHQLRRTVVEHQAQHQNMLINSLGKRKSYQPTLSTLQSMNSIATIAIGSSSLQVSQGMNDPSQMDSDMHPQKLMSQDNSIFARNDYRNYAKYEIASNVVEVPHRQKSQDQHDYQHDFEEDIIEQIEEMIESEDHASNEYQNYLNLERNKPSTHDDLQQQNYCFEYLPVEEQKKLINQAFQLDNISEHDIEAQSLPIFTEEEHKSQMDLSRQSSRMTRAAKEDPHIGQGTQIKHLQQKLLHITNNPSSVGYHSLDDQMLFKNVSDIRRNKVQSQSVAENLLNQSSKIELNYSSQDNDQVVRDKNNGSSIDFEEEEGYFEMNFVPGVLKMRDDDDQGEEMNEEEQKYLLEVIESADEEQKQARGRSSVLEGVEDDDIVNQNSSKSSSKERTPNKNMLLGNALFADAIQIQNQNHPKEEEKMITRQSSSSSSRTSLRPTRFTYFAASSLSDDRWLCPICLDIYEDAVETPCCHNLFCEKCIKKTSTCPLCNQRIIGQLKPNIPIRRLVFELSINCYNQACEEVVRKGDMDKHLKVCKFTPLICPNNELCGNILRKDVERHRLDVCPYRIVECFLMCGLMLPLNDMEDHIRDECPKTQMHCRNNCGYIVERGEVERHINIDCPLEVIDCPNKGENLFEEGCSVRLKRKEMEAHKITCNFRRVYCQNQKCNSIIMYKDLHSHDERCLFKIIDCDNKCGQKIQRQILDRHKEVCEFQLVKCPYYDLGCKIEILRKDYKSHLQEEGFNHSMIFIEGQKKKNREIDELKHEIGHLRKEYDVEIKTMFLELNRVKEEIKSIKHHKGGLVQAGNQTLNSSSQNVGFVKKDERRYEPPNFSVNTNSIYEYSQQVRDRALPERNHPNQNIQNTQLRLLNGLENSQSVEIESNAASLAASIQSLGLSQHNANHNIYASQQLRSMQSNPLNNLNNNQSHQHLQIQGANRNVYNKPPLMGGRNANVANGQGVAGQHIGNTHNHNLFGENSNRGRIPILTSNNESSVGNLSERKNPMTVLLGSVNASQESHTQHNQNNFATTSVQARDFFQLVLNNNDQHQQDNRRGNQTILSRHQRQQPLRQRGEPESGDIHNNFNLQRDLDSSNVLYDDDFEIEEEKNDF